MVTREEKPTLWRNFGERAEDLHFEQSQAIQPRTMAAPPADLLAVFETWVAQKPTALVHTFLEGDGSESDSYTMGQLNQATNGVAALIAAKVKPGERALLCYPPGLDFLVAFYGCLKAGVVAVPVFPPDPRKLGGPEADAFASIRTSSGAAVALSTLSYIKNKGLARSLRGFKSLQQDVAKCADLDEACEWVATDLAPDAAVPPMVKAGDLAFLQYTSGSTSEPKGYHDMGLIGSYLGTLYCGGKGYHSSPLDFVRDPTRWVRDMTKYGATHVQAPSFAYGLVARKFLESDKKPKVDLSALVHAINAAEPVRACDVDAFRAAFADHGLKPGVIFPTYGLAEHTVFVCTNGTQRVDFDADALEHGRAAVGGARTTTLFGCGAPPGEVAIVEDGGAAAADGAVGEIWLRSPSRARGYWKCPEKSAADFGASRPGDAAATFVPGRARFGDVEPAGWLRTGDLGFFHEGELFVCGRLKDLLIVRGKNHYPQDLEKTWEDARGAFRPGCSAAVTRATVVAARTAPKTTSGKIARKWCAKALAGGDLDVVYVFNGGGKAPLPKRKGDAKATDCIKTMSPEVRAEKLAALAALADGDLLNSVVALAAGVMKVQPGDLDVDGPVAALGLGSMEGLHLLTVIEEAHGCAPDAELLVDVDMTLRTLCSVLKRGGKAGPRAKIVDGAKLAKELEEADLAFAGAAKRIASKRKDRDRRCTLAQAHLATGALACEPAAPGARFAALVDGGPAAVLVAFAASVVLVLACLACCAVGPAATMGILLATPVWLTTRAKIAGASPNIDKKRRAFKHRFLASIHAKRRTRVYVADPEALLKATTALVVVRAHAEREPSRLDERAFHLATAALLPDVLGAPVAALADRDYLGAAALHFLFDAALAPRRSSSSRRSTRPSAGDGAAAGGAQAAAAALSMALAGKVLNARLRPPR
ncbi:ligase [Aureococcus anophagefferens]|nr:ligase [Aureococcus anophagefferens]